MMVHPSTTTADAEDSKTGQRPARLAPTTSHRGSSPTKIACPGAMDKTLSARANAAGCGFLQPTSTQNTAASTLSKSPRRANSWRHAVAGLSQGVLDTIPVLMPRLRSDSSRGIASGSGLASSKMGFRKALQAASSLGPSSTAYRPRSSCKRSLSRRTAWSSRSVLSRFARAKRSSSSTWDGETPTAAMHCPMHRRSTAGKSGAA